MRSFQSIAIVFLVVFLSACSKQTIRPYSAEVTPTDANSVEILYSYPSYEYVKVGGISINHWKPGFSDPTVEDAANKLQGAGAELGADAVVILDTEQNNDRTIFIRAEGIRRKK